MNFPLFYWNIARIPVATTFLFWWCATLVKFSWEVAPQCFLFEWKSASEKFGREVAPPRFHFQSKSASHAGVAPLDLFFWTEIRFPRYRRGGRSRHIGPQKESHVLSTYKRQEHASKTRAKCEKHASDTRETCEYFRPLITQLRHPPPLLWWDSDLTVFWYCVSWVGYFPLWVDRQLREWGWSHGPLLVGEVRALLHLNATVESPTSSVRFYLLFCTKLVRLVLIHKWN